MIYFDYIYDKWNVKYNEDLARFLCCNIYFIVFHFGSIDHKSYRAWKITLSTLLSKLSKANTAGLPVEDGIVVSDENIT